MGAEDRHGLGYRSVDEDPNVPILIETMDETSRWDATRRLRAWERERLRLVDGDRLIDVGCGSGDAAFALAADVGTAGEVVGVDVSAEMLDAARSRKAAGSSIRFTLGDALELPEPDGSFDAARCERTLQWVSDPVRATAELARVLRPEGRICLIDTDWSTLRLDVGDDSVGRVVRDAFSVERSRPSHVGSRLIALVGAAGFHDIDATAATQVWTGWDPDETPAPTGCFSMTSLAADLVSTGHLDTADADGFVATVLEAARRGRFLMTLTMFAVSATKQPPT